MKVRAKSVSHYTKKSLQLWKEKDFIPLIDCKLSIILDDNHIIECSGFKRSVHGKIEEHACISTQAGCKYGCRFCSSGKKGFRRNLTATEILSELRLLAKEEKVQKFDRINFMGIGEPLDNVIEVIKVIKHLMRAHDLYTGVRPLALATNGGLPDALLKIAKLPLQVEIWLSLHAVDDAKRNKLMPVNKVFNVCAVFDLANRYTKISHAPIWLNYMIFKDFNNTDDDARKISELLKNKEDNFKLILTEPNNDVLGLKKAEYGDLVMFERKLRNMGVKNTITRFVTAGISVKAGCGEFIFVPADLTVIA